MPYVTALQEQLMFVGFLLPAHLTEIFEQFSYSYTSLKWRIQKLIRVLQLIFPLIIFAMRMHFAL